MNVSQAHEHADRAELLYARGDFEGASEEHLHAAESYLQAIDSCEDPAAKHSLRLMHEDHLKLSRDAKRARQERTRQQQQQAQQQPPSRNTDLTATVTIDQVPRRMADSTSSVEHTIEDSYMMLGGRPGEHNEAFDQFWKTLEGMLENLSQPVAFATAPLARTSPGNKEVEDDGDDDDGGESDASSNDSFCIIDSKDPVAPQTPKSATFGSSASNSPTNTKKSKKSTPDPSLARSAYPPPPRIQQLEAENAALKTDLERAIMRANMAERTLRQRAGQELALRESILSVRREAQRAMSATTAGLRGPSLAGPVPSRTQTLITSPSFIAPVSPAVPAPAPAPAVVAPPPVPAVKLPVVPSPRIAELEEEIRQLKAENEKQKAQMAKYRERWEKLKESAKRKRAAKGQLETSSAANVTIPEEQEPEAEQLDAGQETPATPVAIGSGLNSHSVLRSPESIVASH